MRQIVVSLVIRDASGRYLMGRKLNSRLYCPPGGKVEDGEKLKNAAKRELLEETGILVKKGSLILIGYAEPSNKLVMFFDCEIGEQVAYNTEPHKTEDWEWIDLDTTPDAELVEGIRISDGGSMLVQATDRKFYKKPIFMTPTGVVITDDYGARCAVRAARNSSEVSARSRAQRFLRDVGINAKILEGCRSEEPILFGSNLEYGYDFDIVFRAMIPVPEAFVAKVEEPAKDESCAGFKTDFYINDLVDFLLGTLTLPLLNRALLGEWIDTEEKLVRRRLLKQAPFLRGVKDHTESGIAKFGITWQQKAIKVPFDIGIPDEELSLD